MKKAFLSRFNRYQLERFPFAVLTFTTFAVVAISFAISLPATDSLLHHATAIIIGTLTGLLFLFHMRVSDDHKDNWFDATYHKNRPIQAGIIKLYEIRWLNRIGLAAQVLLNAVFFPIA